MAAQSSKRNPYLSCVLPIFIAAGVVVGGLVFLIRWADQQSEQERLAAQKSRQEKVIADLQRLDDNAPLLDNFNRLRQTIIATLEQGPGVLPQPSNQIRLNPPPVTLQNFRNVDPERLIAANTLITDYNTFADLRYSAPADVATFSSTSALPSIFACGPVCRNLTLYEDKELYPTPDDVPSGVYGIPVESLQLIQQLRYVIVVRPLQYASPEISGDDAFSSGIVDVESTIWEATTGRPLGTVLSRATNGDSVEFSTYSGDAAVGNDAQAINALRSQLYNNAIAKVREDLTQATGGDFID